MTTLLDGPILYNLAINQIESCYALAEKHLQRRFPRPLISLDQRGRIAGCAKLQENKIKLNAKLFSQNQTEFLNVVIPHEVCHLLVFIMHGRVKPHGKEWQTLMKNLFGLPAKATHSMDVSAVSQATFHYRCACNEVELSVIRHNKVKRGAVYICKRCLEPLEHYVTEAQ